MSPTELRQTVLKWGWPAYRADQVLKWVYDKGVTDVRQMTDLPRAAQEILAGKIDISSGQILANQRSSDGTVKMLLGWQDGTTAETVMIPEGSRRTVCVSTQCGCPVGCRFCASGLNGLTANLSAGQIVAQVFAMNLALMPEGRRVSHVVFMGMGEPLANYANTMKAVRNLHDAAVFGISARRITISTVGIPARMRELAGEALPVNLALSLHAPTDELRRELIPWAQYFPISELIDALRFYFERTGREVTLEYILLGGVNDRPQHARLLAVLCRQVRCNVNLILYNEVSGLPFARPSKSDAAKFQKVLREEGVNVHVRRSRGADIDAACGQLRRRSAQTGTVAGAAQRAEGEAASDRNRATS